MEQAPETRPAEDASRALEVSEIRALLRELGWGTLATVRDGEPYGVPVGYALGGDCVYIASGLGRKLSNLERDPAVCLTVCAVQTFDVWRSVVIEGRAEEVTGLRARAVAIAAFVGQKSPRGGINVTDARRMLGARLFRLSLEGAAGRARG